MSNRRASTVVFLAVLAQVAGSSVFAQAQHDQHKPDTHTHAAAAKIVNPVKADETSSAAGQKLFATHCATCHGSKGGGDGVQAAKFTPRPSNLVDAEWKHGPSDGEIFTVIRNGVPKTAMSPFGKKMTERQTWDIVNYMRGVGPKVEPAHAH